jgi:hypothetical protein
MVSILEVATDRAACDRATDTADNGAARTGNRVTDHGSASTAHNGSAYGLLAGRATGCAECGDSDNRERGNFLHHGKFSY